MDPSATASVYDDAFQTQHHCHQQQPPGLSSLSSSSSTSSSSSNSLAFHLDLTPQACSGRVLRLLFGPLQAAGLICGGTLSGAMGGGLCQPAPVFAFSPLWSLRSCFLRSYSFRSPICLVILCLRTAFDNFLFFFSLLLALCSLLLLFLLFDCVEVWLC